MMEFKQMERRWSVEDGGDGAPRFPSPPDFQGLEEVGSIRRVEADLSNPTMLVFESSRFLGRRNTHSPFPLLTHHFQ